MRRGEVKNTNIVADMSNINSIFPDWKPKYSLDDTICNAVEYYKFIPDREISNMIKFYGTVLRGDRD